MLRFMHKMFVGLFLLAAVYLFTVFLWARSAADELLTALPARSQVIPLHPRHLDALIRIEDPTFYRHHGLNLSKGQGLTTLTSVVAREVFLEGHDLDGVQGGLQTFYRGVFECCKRVDLGRDVMALVLDSRATKQQQLNLYLSGTYFGSLEGKAVVGFEAAARAYVGKELSQLTDREFYGLMAMPMAPNRYHPVRHPERHAERARRIEAVATGKCEPDGWLDLTYEACATGPAKNTTPSSSA